MSPKFSEFEDSL